MSKSKKRILAAALFCTLATTGFTVLVNAEEIDQETEQNGKAQQTKAEKTDELTRHYLAETLVEAQKSILPGGWVSTSGAVGLLGDKNTLDVPFTQMNFTEQNIEDFGGPNQALDNILVNMPSVTQAGTMLHQDFAIRGQYIDGSSGGYVNGVPGMGGQFVNPTVAAESIELLAGPSKVISSTFPSGERTGAAGMINFTSKKATLHPITRYTQTFSGESGFSEHLDFGRRFGKNNEWGIRINAEVVSGNPTHYPADRDSQSIYANIDHKDANSKTNLLVGYQHYKVEKGLRWFSLGAGVTKLPTAPSGKTNYSFDGIEKETEGTILVLNHEQNLGKTWKAFFNGGYSQSNLKKNITGQSSLLTIKNDAGDFDGKYFTRRTPSQKYYAQLGVKGDFSIGKVKNNIVAAVDRSWSRSWTGVRGGTAITNFTGPGGNIYTGVNSGSAIIPDFDNYLSSSATYWGWSLVDTLEFGKVEVLLGVHQHNASSSSYNEAGKKTKTTDTDGLCPTYGITYKPTDKLSLYASHSEFFDAGSIVGTAYINAGEILAPAKTKQNEIGIKYENAGLLTTFCFFDNKAASSMSVDIGEKLPYLANDAETEYKGVEFTINGRIANKWNAMGGLMYLNAVRNKTEKGAYDGYKVNGIPRWNGVLALQYNPDQTWSWIGRAVYTGSAPIANEKFVVPAHLTFDFGVKYKTKLNGKPLTFSAMCYNLTDKDYWIAYGSNLHVSSPRTVMLSAQFDF